MTCTARLTVVETVYHEPAQGRPVQADSRFVRRVSGETFAPYRCTAGAEWLPLACDGAGMLVVANDEGKGLFVRPAAEEAAAIAGRVVEVAVGESVFARVRPGESLRLEPAGPLAVRCLSGPARITVTVFPGDADG